MKHTQFLLLLFWSIAINTSCKKNNEIPANQLLTQAGWKMVADERDPGNGTFSNIISSCGQDDLLSFSEDNSVSYSIGIACDASEEDMHGTWRFAGNGKALEILSDGLTSTFMLKELSQTRLILVFSYQAGPLQLRQRRTFEH